MVHIEYDEEEEFVGGPATLLGRVLPLRVELADLKDTLKEKEEKITNLEGRSVTREVLLGKVEGELHLPTSTERENQSSCCSC